MVYQFTVEEIVIKFLQFTDEYIGDFLTKDKFANLFLLSMMKVKNDLSLRILVM